ncbi:uncharacterized protein LOC133878200 [Alnus glutinosa]|uniref:uncharacterized protein LOC133878200 n=1 Tax=Alnus glutinosa TaxID=3517 RepID=UPI002D77FB63|nr:uncharacterized protein LOC133878200 [Alnus glutinosa]
MATISLSLSPKPFLSINKPKPYCFLAPKKATTSSERPSLSHNLLQRITHKSTQVWRVSAASGGEVVPSEAAPLESSQEIVSTSDDGVSNIISGLLLIAFIGLSVLTIGVIYIGVTDFLQKREREKFEKEEAANKKKTGKKKKVRARAGPRGFGQKIDDDYDED